MVGLPSILVIVSAAPENDNLRDHLLENRNQCGYTYGERPERRPGTLKQTEAAARSVGRFVLRHASSAHLTKSAFFPQPIQPFL
jgi:hypothetical protein